MTFLKKVIEEKKEIVRLKKRQRSIEELQSISLEYKKRPFFDLFKKRFLEDVRIIGEIKMASPSVGTLAEGINIARQAEIYESSGVYAISVITEERYFNGRLEFIPSVRSSTELPVLRKDFIVDAYEVYESKAAGADCVLLIGEALEKELLADCLSTAKGLNIDCLIEIHDLYTFEKVADLNGFLLGINNRDLKTLKVDISKGYKMLDYIPDNIPVIIESGIEKREEILMFMEKGVSGFLIGTALMRSKNPSELIAKLRGVNDRKD